MRLSHALLLRRKLIGLQFLDNAKMVIIILYGYDWSQITIGVKSCFWIISKYYYLWFSMNFCKNNWKLYQACFEVNLEFKINKQYHHFVLRSSILYLSMLLKISSYFLHERIFHPFHYPLLNMIRWRVNYFCDNHSQKYRLTLKWPRFGVILNDFMWLFLPGT